MSTDIQQINILSPGGNLEGYIQAVNSIALLTAEQEKELAARLFYDDDVDAARSAARYNLAFFGQMPNYRKQWRACGFEEEVTALEQAWQKRDRKLAATRVSDEMVEQVCVFGSPGQCRDQLAAFHEAGAGMPLLAVSPVNEDRLGATRKAIELLAPG